MSATIADMSLNSMEWSIEMTPLQMIEEFRKGCTCAGPMFDKMLGKPEGTTPPEECIECTQALIVALYNKLKEY